VQTAVEPTPTELSLSVPRTDNPEVTEYKVELREIDGDTPIVPKFVGSTEPDVVSVASDGVSDDDVSDDDVTDDDVLKTCRTIVDKFFFCSRPTVAYIIVKIISLRHSFFRW